MRKTLIIAVLAMTTIATASCGKKEESKNNKSITQKVEQSTNNVKVDLSMFEFEDVDGGVTVKKVNISSYEDDTFYFPTVANGKKVIGIGLTDRTYQGLTLLGFKGNKVVLGENTKYLWNYAFSNLTQEIELNEGLEEIGYFAFSRASFSNIVLPSTLKSIGSGAFNECDNIKEIVIPDNVQVGMYAFSKCEQLERIEVGDGVVLNYSAIENCPNLKEVVLKEDTVLNEYDNGLEYGIYTFNECENLVVKLVGGSDAEEFCKKYNIKYEVY